MLLLNKCAGQIAYVSCGGSHTGAVTVSGELWMWGCPDNGRLGIPGLNPATPVFEPELCKEFVSRGIRIQKVSCGSSHTLALSQVDEILEGDGELKARVYRGGQVFMAGARSVLGIHCEKFTLAETLKDTPCAMVSAGYAPVMSCQNQLLGASALFFARMCTHGMSCLA